MITASQNASTVYVVDDDQAIRRAMAMLMKSVGQAHAIFSSADDFLEQYSPDCRGCLILDIRMPGMGGLELQDKLIEKGSTLPTIFVTGYGDIPMAVEAMQKGAFDFIEKPFRDQELLDRINDALAADSSQRSRIAKTNRVSELLDRLTNREREVMELVIEGKPNKIVAHELGVSQRTVEIHRARVMEKMEAGSLAELVRMSLLVKS